MVGGGTIDFIADLGAQMPMRVIGMLLGIPEEDQQELRDHIDAGLSLEAGKSREAGANLFPTARFSEYIEWRRKHPSDDLMTELLTARFVDDTGALRTLRDDELIGYIGLLAGAPRRVREGRLGRARRDLVEARERRVELLGVERSCESSRSPSWALTNTTGASNGPPSRAPYTEPTRSTARGETRR